MKITKTGNATTVANYLTQQIAMSGKTQRVIAEECGYEKPNMITMFKQGKTPLPLPKVILMAKSIGVDPMHLLRICMKEYRPDEWELLESLLGSATTLTENELKTIDVIRSASGGNDVCPSTQQDKDELSDLVDKWVKRAVPVSVTTY